VQLCDLQTYGEPGILEIQFVDSRWNICLMQSLYEAASRSKIK